MLKKGILSYQKHKNNQKFTEFLKFGPEIRIFCADKNLFRELQLDLIIFLLNFSTAILKNNIKSEKTCPGFLFLILDLEKINFYVFCAMEKKAAILYLISLS